MDILSLLFPAPDVPKMVIRKNVQGLIKALSYKKSSSIRMNAAHALGDIGFFGDSFYPLLTAFLSENDPVVRKAIGSSLVKIGEFPAVERFCYCLADGNDGVHCDAAYWLGEIGNPWALDQLILSYECDSPGPTLNTHRSETRRTAVLDAVAKIGGTRAITLLLKAIDDPSANVRHSAASTLARIGASRAIGPLLLCYKKENRVGTVIAEAIGVLGNSQTIDPLIELYSEISGVDKIFLSQALATIVKRYIHKIPLSQLRRITKLPDFSWEERTALYRDPSTDSYESDIIYYHTDLQELRSIATQEMARRRNKVAKSNSGKKK
jgi:HEAT repeat protein